MRGGRMQHDAMKSFIVRASSGVAASTGSRWRAQPASERPWHCQSWDTGGGCARKCEQRASGTPVANSLPQLGYCRHMGEHGCFKDDMLIFHLAIHDFPLEGMAPILHEWDERVETTRRCQMDAMPHSMVTSFDGRMARFGEESRSKVACIRLGGYLTGQPLQISAHRSLPRPNPVTYGARGQNLKGPRVPQILASCGIVKPAHCQATCGA